MPPPIGLIERYRDLLPVDAESPIVTLNEGSTPLIRLRNIPADLGGKVEIFAKFEGLNPTGSFKDRGMCMAVTKAVEEGSRAVICASTGNTSASAAAYAARAGLTAFVLIPEGKIAQGKLAQAVMHGAVVLHLRGNFDVGMRLVKEIGAESAATIVNSINPYRIQGQKTIAFEIIEALGDAPDFHCLPVGNAGNITAHWIGYTEGFERGMARSRPVMAGYQAAGAAPFVHGHPIDDPETVATAIRIGRPQSWEGALRAQTESGGWFDAFSDERILAAQKLLAEREGIFCEPASAAAVAGAISDIRSGRIPAGSRVVCTLTGHGLKDPGVAARHAAAALTVEAEPDAIRAAIASKLPD